MMKNSAAGIFLVFASLSSYGSEKKAPTPPPEPTVVNVDVAVPSIAASPETKTTQLKGGIQIAIDTDIYTANVQWSSPRWIVAPFLLLPLLFVRRRLFARSHWLTICFCAAALVSVVLAAGCGGGKSSGTNPPTQSQVVSSGTVTLIVQ